MWSRRYPFIYGHNITSHEIHLSQIVGDDTRAIDSVLTADVWRDHLLKEEASLNARLGQLEKESDDKRFVDAREEAEVRLADVHARLSDMEAESGPARAASLLAGESPFKIVKYPVGKPQGSGIIRFGLLRGGSTEADKFFQWWLAV